MVEKGGSEDALLLRLELMVHFLPSIEVHACSQEEVKFSR